MSRNRPLSLRADALLSAYLVALAEISAWTLGARGPLLDGARDLAVLAELLLAADWLLLAPALQRQVVRHLERVRGGLARVHSASCHPETAVRRQIDAAFLCLAQAGALAGVHRLTWPGPGSLPPDPKAAGNPSAGPRTSRGRST